jgi:hypothetical protein
MSATVDLRPGFAWSYSKLKNFETCPKRHYHYDIARDVKEPESAELQFGNALHKAYASRLAKGIPLPATFARAEPMLARLASAPGKKYVEQKWAIGSTFQHAPWSGPAAWFKTIVDFGLHRPDQQVISIFDWKTGKVKEDTTQLKLMAAVSFIHFPTVQRVKAALLFTEHDHVEKEEYVRADQREIWSEMLPRVKELRAANEQHNFPPKPGFLCRKWCAVVSCPHHGR